MKRTSCLVVAVLLSAAACKKSDPATTAAKAGSGSAAKAPGSAGSAGSGSAAKASGSASAAGSGSAMAATGSGSAGGSADAGLAAGSGSAAAAPAGAIKFAQPAAQPGDKDTQDESLQMRFTIQTAGGPLPIERLEASSTITEVLEVADGVATKAKFTYAKRSEVETQAGQKQEAPQPLLGKSYVVALTAAGLTFTTEAGAPVSPEEQAALTEEHDDFGKANPFARLIASRAWAVGEAYAATPADLAAFNEDNAAKEKPTAQSITLTLTSNDNGVATFALALALKVTGKAQFTISLSGTVKVDPKLTRPLSLEMAGPMLGTAMGSALTGTMSGNTTWTY